MRTAGAQDAAEASDASDPEPEVAEPDETPAPRTSDENHAPRTSDENRAPCTSDENHAPRESDAPYAPDGTHEPDSAYEACLDGLFTYCLSALCDHDVATAAVADVLDVAGRRRRGHRRAPRAEDERRAWLYALARWACRHRLAEARPARSDRLDRSDSLDRSDRSDSSDPSDRRAADGRDAGTPQEERRLRRRRELALLAWPDAAGTTPQEREALELAVRHRLSSQEVAAVLGLNPASARELLASAACEVERTRAALAVIGAGACPDVTRITGDRQYVLSTAVRDELVRHVDDCPRCRRTAERAVPGRWPGADVAPTDLPLVEAPRAAITAALAHHPRTRATIPRFDRRGFPVGPREHAARRDRRRARAVTVTVVAAVMTAPALALWFAYRDATPESEHPDGQATTATEARPDDDGHSGNAPTDRYEHAGDNHPGGAGSRRTRAGGGDTEEGPGAGVSVEVLSPGTGGKAAGRLAVTAGRRGDVTLITLRAIGGSAVRWSVTPSKDWLRLSDSSGTVGPGESDTVKVYVDPLREPSGRWRATVGVAPTGTLVAIEGTGPGPARMQAGGGHGSHGHEGRHGHPGRLGAAQAGSAGGADSGVGSGAGRGTGHGAGRGGDGHSGSGTGAGSGGHGDHNGHGGHGRHGRHGGSRPAEAGAPAARPGRGPDASRPGHAGGSSGHTGRHGGGSPGDGDADGDRGGNGNGDRDGNGDGDAD